MYEDELVLLLERIHESEDFVERAEAYFKKRSADWPVGLAANFEIFLERKRDQILYEKERAEKMGSYISLDLPPQGIDVDKVELAILRAQSRGFDI